LNSQNKKTGLACHHETVRPDSPALAPRFLALEVERSRKAASALRPRFMDPLFLRAAYLGLFCLTAACRDGVSDQEKIANQITKQESSINDGLFLNLNGEWIDPFERRENKVTVFVFLSSDCPISNRYAPEIQRLHAAYSAKGIAFWLAYPNRDDTPEVARKHANEFRYAIPALLDPKHRLVRLAKARVTPEAAVFLRDRSLIYHGRIDDRHVDFGKARPSPTKRDLQEVLDAIVSGKPVAVESQPAVGCYIPDAR
jgi:hypothetical protein